MNLEQARTYFLIEKFFNRLDTPILDVLRNADRHQGIWIRVGVAGETASFGLHKKIKIGYPGCGNNIPIASAIVTRPDGHKFGFDLERPEYNYEFYSELSQLRLVVPGKTKTDLYFAGIIFRTDLTDKEAEMQFQEYVHRIVNGEKA